MPTGRRHTLALAAVLCSVLIAPAVSAQGYTFRTLDVPGGGAEAHGINTAGQIVGEYFDSTGAGHGFLAKPIAAVVPDPASFVRVVAGLGVVAVVGAVARRRASSHARDGLTADGLTVDRSPSGVRVAGSGRRSVGIGRRRLILAHGLT